MTKAVLAWMTFDPQLSLVYAFRVLWNSAILARDTLVIAILLGPIPASLA